MNHFLAIASIIKKYNINNDIFRLIYKEYLNINTDIIIKYWYKYIYKTNILSLKYLLEINKFNIYNYNSLLKIKYINNKLNYKSLGPVNKLWWIKRVYTLSILNQNRRPMDVKHLCNYDRFVVDYCFEFQKNTISILNKLM
tara:strand:+ start:5788 stop:6210 length:423 start_codon:yes stop_codon:yes gene_type:complete